MVFIFHLPTELIILLVDVMEKRFDEIMASATTLINIENSHMAKYGNAEYIPFWKEKKNWRLTIGKKL